MSLGIDLSGRADEIFGRFTEFGAADSPVLLQGQEGMDPKTTAALIDGGSKVLGGLLGGGSGAAPAQSGATQYVNFSTGTNTIATSGSKASSEPSLPWYVWLIAGVVAIKFFKKKA